MYLFLSPRTLYYMFFTSRVSITTYAAANVEHACAVPYLRTRLHATCVVLTRRLGKLRLKVMHYNIALLPKKVTTNFVTQLLLWKVMCYITFALLSRYFLNMFVFNTRSSIIANVKPFTHKSVMNKPQSEGRVNSRLYSRRRKRRSTLFRNQKGKALTLLVTWKVLLLHNLRYL